MIKRIVLCCFMIVFLSNMSWAASDASIRKYAFNAPDSISEDERSLTKYLVKPYRKDYDKLKSIAYWIASHIAYDNYQFDNDKIYAKNSAYQYDILKAKAGVCEDFAKLFTKMARIAGVKVSYVSGYVVDTPRVKKRYKIKKDEVPHAWNEVELDGRKFYVDTTWMASMRIGKSEKRSDKRPTKHRREIKKRERKETPVNPNINAFYFDFTSETEVQKYQKDHWAEK